MMQYQQQPATAMPRKSKTTDQHLNDSLHQYYDSSFTGCLTIIHLLSSAYNRVMIRECRFYDKLQNKRPQKYTEYKVPHRIRMSLLCFYLFIFFCRAEFLSFCVFCFVFFFLFLLHANNFHWLMASRESWTMTMTMTK